MAPNDPIVISDTESETESETEAIDLVAQQKANSSVQGPPSKSSSDSNQDASSSSASSIATHNLASLIPNRAQLEKERLKRVKRRRQEQGLASDSDPDHEPSRKKLQVTGSFSDATSSKISSPRVTSASGSTSIQSNPIQRPTDPIVTEDRFWNGTVKHSYNRYAAKGKQGSTFGSFLLPCTPGSSRGLIEVVMATYDLDMDWLYAHFPRNVKVTLILNPDQGDYRTDPTIPRPGLYPTGAFGAFAKYPGWTICVPNRPKGGWLTQHMKFLLLVHETFLRVVILTGNLNGFDWERIENTAYVHDFPLLKDGLSCSSSIPSHQMNNDFRPQIERVLQSLGIPRSHRILSEQLAKYDFSRATEVRIVASWPEASVLSGWDSIETQGLGRLGKVVRDFGFQQKTNELRHTVVEAQGSSLANHDRRWLQHFHILASGIDPRNVLPFKGKPAQLHQEYLAVTHRSAAHRNDSLETQRDGFDTQGFPPIKICFPTQKWVETQAVEGPEGAGSFFGKAKEFTSSEIQHLYFQPVSHRGNMMIHAKSLLAIHASERSLVDEIFARGSTGSSLSFTEPKRVGGTSLDKQDELKETPIGWSYLGSANFTRAAHGNISGSVKQPSMSTMNWELGVVFPIYASELKKQGILANCLRAIPYRRPVQQYGAKDTPWNRETLELQPSPPSPSTIHFCL